MKSIAWEVWSFKKSVRNEHNWRNKYFLLFKAWSHADHHNSSSYRTSVFCQSDIVSPTFIHSVFYCCTGWIQISSHENNSLDDLFAEILIWCWLWPWFESGLTGTSAMNKAYQCIKQNNLPHDLSNPFSSPVTSAYFGIWLIKITILILPISGRFVKSIQWKIMYSELWTRMSLAIESRYSSYPHGIQIWSTGSCEAIVHRWVQRPKRCVLCGKDRLLLMFPIKL